MFKAIPKLKKLEAVREVLKGKPLSKVAKNYRVNRNSLHSWLKRAKKGMDKALIPEKRGPELSVESFRQKEEKIKKMQAKYNEVKEQIRQLKSNIAQNKNKENEGRLGKCSFCGCEKTYKNGTYQIFTQRLLSLIKRSPTNRFTVKQFICGYCNRRLGFKLDSIILLNKQRPPA